MVLRSLSSTYLRRKCKTPDGSFQAYVSGGSSLKVLDPRGLTIEPVHQRFIRDWIKPNATVWDIGANLGLFAFPAALKARQGSVYAFEPDVELAANLLRSLRLTSNKGLNVSLFCLAISDADGTANFQISTFSRAMNKLEAVGKWHDGEVKVLETRSVATLTIDTLAKGLLPPTVIKIDVEGHELSVIEGIGRYLNNNSCKIKQIQFEYGGTYLDANIKLKDIFNLLSEKYNIGKIFPDSVFYTDYSEKLEDFQYSNYLAILKDYNTI